MYLRKVAYQLGVRVKSLVLCFHKSHLQNLALLVIGIAYSRSVSLPKAAVAVPFKRIQLELKWFTVCLPEGARKRTTIIADREFHSIHLATWIEKSLRLNFVLRIKAGTKIEFLGDWYRAEDLASRGRTRIWKSIKVTMDRKASHRVNLVTVGGCIRMRAW